MSRLVVVSNRIADPRKTAAGGLAVALADALNTTGGLWFGWSGKVVPAGEPVDPSPQVRHAGKVSLAMIDLTQEEHDNYYLGYSNSVLWPVFHYRLDLAEFRSGFFEGYRRVNKLFAQRLAPLLRPDDVVWIHDYHLIPLAAELRALGCKQRMGFFLHIPLPPQTILSALPGDDWMLRSFFAYDLVGLQSESDCAHFGRYARHEGNAQVLEHNLFRAFGRTVRAQAIPIGIDVEEFQRLGENPESIENYAMMRELYAKRRVLVGVDRLDYSKGLPQRVQAFNELLQRYPENRMSATLVQVASPSRESLYAYNNIRQEMESLCGSINGEYGELDWMPVRYIHRTMARHRLPGLYRASAVALVTPLRDGMNLVAKEFVAVQDPDDPGVLVLSRFAGAAEQLRDAVLVNPYDTPSTADAIQRALRMPLEERVRRHRALLATIQQHDVAWWQRTFLDTLKRTEQHAVAA